MRWNPVESREVERTRYWQGQMLEAHDLSGQMTSDLSLRWWHNRALHSAYGVAIGYEATAHLDPAGLLDGFEFAPGVAYDTYGRALALLRRHRIPLPKTTNEPAVTLLIRYRETCSYPDPREIAGVCLTCCEDSLLQEQPAFVWTSADPLDPRAGVPLVRVNFTGATRTPEIEVAFTEVTTEPLARPYLVNGSTIPGATLWEPWQENQTTVGIQTDVDTSAAGFSQTPCYFAWLAACDPQIIPGLPNVGVFTHINKPAWDGFRFRILFGRGLQVVPLLASHQQSAVPPFYVCWLGCESIADMTQCLNPEVRKSCCG
jgi:hypothetical protein